MVNQDTIHRLIHSDNAKERQQGIVDLYLNFVDLPDKKQACEDIHRLIQDENRDVRMFAAKSLGAAFPHYTNNKQAWDDIIILIKDKEYQVQHWAANSLCSAFPYISDRKQAWEDIIQLVYNEEDKLLQFGIKSISNVFRYTDDKNKAWADLIFLTKARNMFARSGAVYAMGANFRYVDDKNKAWKDLHRLTLDASSNMQWEIAEILGDIFPYIPNENQVLNDLNRLALDKISGLRISANYSLGRISIFKATETETEKDFRIELENALKFFEKSSNEVSGSEFLIRNPAKFCLPFYRSFYTITFKKEEAKAEVQRYLEEAKSAVEGSDSKNKLLEVVENLGNALKEAQKVQDFDDVKSDLNTYMRYCDRAYELLDTTEENAPGASRLIRKGMPIIDERITGIIGEIQETAKAACQQSLGTQAEEIACAANKAIQKWYIDNQEQMTMAVENVIFSISIKIPNIPENKRIFDKIEEIRNEGNMRKQYQGIAVLVALIPSAIVHKGDVINVSKVMTSDNSQTIIKGNENTNNPVNSSTFGFQSAKKTSIDILNSSATVAAFAGFIVVEIGTYFYPLSYNHLISVIAAAIIFTIMAMLNRR